MENAKIPPATGRRLPIYYRFMQNAYESGKLRVSSADLSSATGIDSTTIRRDFSYFGALGKKGYGYDVQNLLLFFRKKLDDEKLTKVALLGVGNLGTALLNYNFNKNNNTRIDIAFDIDPEKIGKNICGVPIFNLNEMEWHLKNSGIEVAILTVPSKVAQEIVERLVAVNIQAILNFAPEHLKVPNNIRVHNIDLAAELQSLVFFMKQYPMEND
ncbi:MAG: redox-sensing transcriptional repressor Rex [Bacillales bacterium]|jgi:redox-sensing transcriptional repressor|nr:redox-sensing transcriptional repressor Rex [Bacillales bacterium]